MVSIGKVEPKWWPDTSGPRFSEVQITNLREGSPSVPLASPMTPWLNIFLDYQLRPDMLRFPVFSLCRLRFARDVTD